MESVIVLMVSQAIIKVVGLIYKLYLTNKQGFGDEGNAIYGAAFQMYALFLTICSIGVPNAISKLVASKVAVGDNNGAYRIFKIAFALYGLLGFVCSTVLFFGAKYIANTYLLIPESEIAILVLSPSVFLVAIASVLKGYFNGKEKINITANSQSVEQIFKTIITIVVVEQIASISCNNTSSMAAGAAMATTIASLVNVTYLYKHYKKIKKKLWREVRISKKSKKENVSKIIKEILIVSVPIALCGVFSAILKTIDALTVVRMLKGIIGEREATLQYGILNGKIDTLITLPYSFNIAIATALVPTVSAAIAKRQLKDAERRIKFSILVTILIGLPCSMCMSLFSNQILQVLFPNASAGAEMLRYSAWTIIFVVLIQTINGALQGMGKVSVPVIAFGIGAIIKLIFNLLLIPIRGVVGAIISSMISHVFALIICFYILNKNINIKLEINKLLVKPIIASVTMVFSSYYCYTKIYSYFPKSISLIICFILGIVVYGVAILCLKILSKEEMLMIPYGQKGYICFERRRNKTKNK